MLRLEGPNELGTAPARVAPDEAEVPFCYFELTYTFGV